MFSVLETQVGQSLNEFDEEKKCSLRKMYCWLQEPFERMRLLAVLIDSAQGGDVICVARFCLLTDMYFSGLKGGALASAIGAYLVHGDAQHSVFVTKIMRDLCRPLYAMIQKWVSSGDLVDPFNEFFVASDSTVPKERLCKFFEFLWRPWLTIGVVQGVTSTP